MQQLAPGSRRAERPTLLPIGRVARRWEEGFAGRRFCAGKQGWQFAALRAGRCLGVQNAGHLTCRERLQVHDDVQHVAHGRADLDDAGGRADVNLGEGFTKPARADELM